VRLTKAPLRQKFREVNTTDRREFVKTLALGGIAAAATPTILGSLSKVVFANDSNAGRPNFHFVVQSQTAGATDRVALAGDGLVTPSNAVGGGLFTHWKNTGSAPFPIVGAGTWKAKSLRSFDLIGTYGSLAAGVLDMDVDLVRDIPSKAVIPAELKVVCNLGAAALSTGEEEGVTLTVPAAGLEFEPFHPGGGPVPFGVTVFGVDVVSEG
jgi:hypothetical protein